MGVALSSLVSLLLGDEEYPEIDSLWAIHCCSLNSALEVMSLLKAFTFVPPLLPAKALWTQWCPYTYLLALLCESHCSLAATICPVFVAQTW